MRLMYVVTGAHYGGASRHVVRMAQHFTAAGHQVAVVTAPEPRIVREAESAGAKVFENPYFQKSTKLGADVKAIGAVRRAITSFAPHLISAHSTKAGFAARACAAALRFRPIIFTAHGWAFAEGRASWKRALLAVAEAAAALPTMRIVCVSEYDRKLALRFRVGRPDTVCVIHNGIDPEPFISATGTSVRATFRLDDDPVITMIARLEAQKDPFTMLRACQRLRHPFRLLVVGDGVLRGAMDAFLARDPRLRERVVFAGEQTEIPDILAASDVYALASRWEGLPRSIIEAMLAARPVVCTRVGGVPELIDHGVTGLLVPPRDVEALAGALDGLLADAARRAAMGRAGRLRALRSFTADRMLAETEALYHDLLDATRTYRGGARPCTT